MTETTAQAIFGSGCFWCGQALFKQLRGVLDVTVGYAGGAQPKPTYEEVCTGTTGHAEVFRVTFDPSIVSYRQLVEVFFLSHDPTTLNRQGHDVGTQYRSIIFTTNDDQAATATAVREEVQTSKSYDAPIVTTIEPLTTFYPAEGYHQDYFAKNPDAAYCQAVITPKIAKFKQTFKQLLKADNN